jgi:hypothetical protein
VGHWGMGTWNTALGAALGALFPILGLSDPFGMDGGTRCQLNFPDDRACDPAGVALY